MKYSHDKLADNSIDILQKLSPSGPPYDYVSLLKEHHGSHPSLSQLWTEVNRVPGWVDWNQLSRGQDVFYRYGGAALTGLAFQSLLGGLGSWRVVEVLARTGGFNTKSARKRLYETTQMVLQVTKELEPLKPGGSAWETCVRVRILHAQVRKRIIKLLREDPTYFSLKDWGVPVSDLDSIATIATFSSALIWQSLPRQGLILSSAEAEDYIALWRYVAYLLGTPTDGFFDSAKSARITLESLLLHEIEPSETSRVLAHNMLQSLTRVPPLYSSEGMICAMARWLNGHALCDALGVPQTNWYYYFLMAGQCLFFMFSIYLTRIWPWWDKRKQAMMRRGYWWMIVESETGLKGKEAKWEFKWVPRLGKITSREIRSEKDAEGAGIEARNARWAIGAVFIMGIFAAVGWLVLRLFVNRVSGR
jgi:hypothetical protein